MLTGVVIDEGFDGGAVLVVDDELAIVETLTEILAHAGYDVASASDGREGLAALARRPATVLVDFMMPVMDGLQMLRALRADPAARHVPVILMSAAGLETVRAAARLGAGEEAPWDAFLAKPFDPDTLLRTLDGVRRRRRVS
jgi:CheY-like chemotaxis protein